MNYANIKFCDIANGPGVRTSLFVSGCTRKCKGCFNAEAQAFDYGAPFTDEVAGKIWDSMAPSYVKGITILGGEPMEPANQEGLLPFLRQTRQKFPGKGIWCFSGFVLDRDLLPEDGCRHTPVTRELLECIDVLVDGPFVESLKDITLRFRGSSNQRLIDVPATLAAGEVVPWTDAEVYGTHHM